MLPAAIVQHIETHVPVFENGRYRVLKHSPIGGGCIHHGHCVETEAGRFFVKWNEAKQLGNFEVEAKGLERLKAHSDFHIPQPIFYAAVEEKYAYLLMEWVEQGSRKENFWEDFGQKLARLHQQTDSRFGLEHDNYIGSLPQSNRQHTDWEHFFVAERLEPQLRLAVNQGHLRHQQRAFDKLFHKIHLLCPKESPALIHGDLWSGNFLVNTDGTASLIDPALYYGHREMEIAFMHLFDSHPSELYSAYEAIYPLAVDWQERIDLYNLYPLLVHVNLFGGHYPSSVERILGRFV